jgi:putative transposase
MTNHYHLVVETKLRLLSSGVQQLSGRHAQRFNERHARYGHLFAGRFSSFVIDTDDHFAAACQYVLENPVRAGLCSRPEDWPWSGSLRG